MVSCASSRTNREETSQTTVVTAPPLTGVDLLHVQPFFPGHTPVALATVEAPGTRAVLVWPLPAAGALLERDVVFLVRGSGEGSDGLLGPYEVPRSGLNRVLGDDVMARIQRPCGLTRAALAAHVAHWLEVFGALVEPTGLGGMSTFDPPRLGEAYRALAMAFSAEAAVLDDVVLDLAMRHAQSLPFTVEDVGEDTAAITIMTRMGLQRARLPLERCGDGVVLAHPQHAITAAH